MAEIFTTFDGIELSFTDTGEDNPVIMLHGFTGSSKINWIDTGIYKKLSASGRRIIMLDARGHGESDKPHTSYSYWNRAMAKDVLALKEHLGLFETDFVGYSMGAKVAIETAMINLGIRGLVLIGLQVRERGWKWDEKERKEAINNMLEDSPKKKSVWREHADSTGGDRKAFAAVLEGTIYPEFTPNNLSKLHAPALILNGTKEYDAQEAASFFPEAQGKSLRGNHYSVLNNKSLPGEVLNFLKSLD